MVTKAGVGTSHHCNPMMVGREAVETAALKEETKAEFEAGLQFYYDRKFSEASVKFSQVLQQNPEDKAARIYLELVPSIW